MTRTVTGVFKRRDETETAIRRLDQAGFAKDRVSIMASEEARDGHFGLDQKNAFDHGAGTAGDFGGAAGALYIGLATAGAVFLPDIRIVVTGMLLGAFAGARFGAAMEGIPAVLIGLGISEYEARFDDAAVHAGHILIAVETRGTAEAGRVKDILIGANALQPMLLAAHKQRVCAGTRPSSSRGGVCARQRLFL